MNRAALFCLLALMLQGCMPSPMSWKIGGTINERAGVAVAGYDVVAYRTDGTATKGDEKYFYRWMDTEWQFASAENRRRFSDDPARYAPEYGGYCAYSASKGITFYGDPEYWILKDNRLFFFFNDFTRRKFVEGIDGDIIEQADAHWAKSFPEMP